eukprot:3081483-Rhodomonas_salina.1
MSGTDKPLEGISLRACYAMPSTDAPGNVLPGGGRVVGELALTTAALTTGQSASRASLTSGQSSTARDASLTTGQRDHHLSQAHTHTLRQPGGVRSTAKMRNAE